MTERTSGIIGTRAAKLTRYAPLAGDSGGFDDEESCRGDEWMRKGAGGEVGRGVVHTNIGWAGWRIFRRFSGDPNALVLERGRIGMKKSHRGCLVGRGTSP